MEWVKKKLERKTALDHGARGTTKPGVLNAPDGSTLPTVHGIEEATSHHPVDVHAQSRLAAKLRGISLPSRRHPCPPPVATSAITVTLFGFTRRGCRPRSSSSAASAAGAATFPVHLPIEADGPRSDVLTVLRLGLATDEFAAVHASGPVEIVLRCAKSAGRAREHVWREREWSLTCNRGLLVSKGAGVPVYDDGEDGFKPYVLQLLESMALGVGVLEGYEERRVIGDLMYIRAPAARSGKASEDYERLQLVQLGDLGFHGITFHFSRE